MTRACFSRSAWAWRDMASCTATAIATPRISTEVTDTPHLAVLLPISSRRCSSAGFRSDRRAASIQEPIIFTERGLRDAVDSLPVVGDFQRRLTCVTDVPENNWVDVD